VDHRNEAHDLLTLFSKSRPKSLGVSHQSID
jgi:hypothetical protein